MTRSFQDAYLASITAATTAIETGKDWSPLLILEVKEQVLGVGLPLVDGSIALALRAFRSTMPGLRPTEAAIVMDVWVGAPSSELRPRDDPASRSALMVVRRRPGSSRAVGREYCVGDGGKVTWVDEPILDESEIGGEVIDALKGWLDGEVSS